MLMSTGLAEPQRPLKARQTPCLVAPLAGATLQGLARPAQVLALKECDRLSSPGRPSYTREAPVSLTPLDMLRCLGIERKTKHTLADSSSVHRPGPCSAACESGGAGSLKSQACCRGLWLQIDFKGSATQLPVDVSCLPSAR